MTRTQCDELSERLVRLMTEMEDDLLRLIADQLARGGDFSDTSKWRMRQLAAAGMLDKKAAKLIAGYTGIQSDMIREAVENAAYKEMGYVDAAVRDMQRRGLLEGTDNLPAQKSAMDAYKAYQKQAQSDLNMVNTVMKYKTKVAFVKAVNSTFLTAQAAQKVHDSLDKHTAALVGGHMSLQEASRRCIKELAGRGIPAFVDKRGHEWTPEAYVTMDLRSTLGNTARAAQNTRCDSFGIKLIEVSSHMGARPLCAPYQGRIFSRDGSSGATKDGAGNEIRYTPLSATSYGEPAGLFGINCGHVQYPFVPGCSFQAYFPYDEDENAERYKQFQKQRQLERNIRGTKRECMMLNETGDADGFADASARLKAQREKYADYCRSKGLGQHDDRTQVYGFDRSVSAKTTWANRKAASSSQNNLTNPQKSITLKSANDFDELSNYLSSTYNIMLDNAVKQLNFNLCKDVIIGVESVFMQFPDLYKNISEILTDKSGVMCCNGRQIKFNPKYFLDENVLLDICKKESSTGHWINNSSPVSIGVHEAAHAVEQLLIDSNTSYIFPFEKTLAWNDCTEAKAIVSQACKNIKKTPYGKGKTNNELKANISQYSLDSPSETMAEAFADVFANGNNAQPISVEIVKLTKEKYNKYKGVT